MEEDAKQTPESASAQADFIRQRSQWSMVRHSLLHSPSAIVGGTIVLLFVIAAVFAPLIAPYGPTDINPVDHLQAPSFKHLAGTDQFGRDIFSRIIYGTRISLRVGFISAGIAAAIGALIGIMAGFYRGRTDSFISVLVNIMLAFPGILLALAIVAILGPGINNVMIAVGIGNIPIFARLVRGSTLSVREEAYVESARAIGAGNVRIMLHHILPNILAPIIIFATLTVATAILVGSSMSFLGLGSKPPEPEWGQMVSAGRDMLRDAWWISTIPGVAILALCLALNILGDGLRDAMDPSLRV